jgi:Heparinase II/III-like protein/Heparinase II/III N-terminus
MELRAKAARWVFILRLVGPHPLRLARTIGYLVSRKTQPRGQQDRLYTAGLPPASIDLTLPPIEMGRLAELPAELQHRAAYLKEEAEQALAHRIDLLGSGPVDLGAEIDWHLDFKSGYRWPARFFREVEVTRLDDESDAKIPWELSRCHHMLALARAACLFEEERYAAEFESQLGSWLDANPAGIGINWTNPMEVGIRAVNLVWAAATLEGWRPLEDALRNRLVESLRWHGHHIEENLEGAPYLRSNHYLGDILGLLVLGSTLNGEPEAGKWFGWARREFEREMAKQVYSDGVSFEASLAYQGLVLEMFLVASFVAAWAGAPLSRAFHDRLRRMVTVSRTARHGDGRIPLFGDQDSGRILPAGSARPPTHDNLLWLAAALEQQTRPIDTEVHPEVAWTFGVESWRNCERLPLAPPPGSAAFPDGGIFVLHTDRAHVVVRCGGVGQNGFGGHAHNDVLSYELSIDDVPLIVDSGTYAYTSDVDARNEFRSTHAHNTVRVDEAEINPIDPSRVFELRQFARPKIEACDLSGDPLELTGSHDGYRQLEPPCVHRRHFSLAAASGELTISDELLGAGEHRVESFVHLAAGSSVRQTGETSFAIAREGAYAEIVFSGVEGGELLVEEAWVSHRYGVRESAPVLVARMLRPFPASLAYTVTPRSAGG